MITQEEKDAVIKFYEAHPTDGYRRCAYMMIDQDVAYIQPSSVYRILKKAGVLRSRNAKKGKKGSGFVHALEAHEQWHSDITNVTVGDTVYYLISILDGFSRSIISWDLRVSMKVADVNIVFQQAKELYPKVEPRCITDNGSQYKCREFAKFISTNNYSHTTTSPYYPQSNGKQERFHGSLKSECIRIKCPLDMDDAKRIIGEYIEHYNTERLHSAISYVTPHDKLNGKQEEVLKRRDAKLEKAILERKLINMIAG